MNVAMGYCRVCAAVPEVRPGAVSENVTALSALARRAAEAGANVVVFPELSLTGYTCADLFYQPSLLSAAEEGLATFLKKSWQLDPLFFLGMPIEIGGQILNCAVACRQGNLLGVVPKSFLPNTGEFYEKRWFTSGAAVRFDKTELCGEEIPFGTDLIFRSRRLRGCMIGVEICEDLWAPIPPCTRTALGGATILCNLSASNELTGKSAYRMDLIRQQSARCFAAYAYAGAGPGESSTDLVFGGHAMIAENGRMLDERPRFLYEAGWAMADVDVQRLVFERSQNATFSASAAQAEPCRVIDFDEAEERGLSSGFLRKVDPFPFVPSDPRERDARCEEIFAIQSSGLATRLRHIGCRDVVVGLSGGLDSALALLVICEAFKRLKADRRGIHVLTMPGFGTTGRTLQNSRRLCAGLGLEIESIDIAPACRQHLADLRHDEALHDVTYENTQARERTQILMDKANQVGGIVIGTGDLSELALGWCTYNGDHMSMYAVNSGVPKTLVRYLVHWVAGRPGNESVSAVLTDILQTPVSPELLPADEAGQIVQKTEQTLGPYEVHDFILYHFLRGGASEEKIRMLAGVAFSERYAERELKQWVDLFFRRFFTQQFKRSCLPDGPKVGTLNLSPRGDWRMPSDAARWW